MMQADTSLEILRALDFEESNECGMFTPCPNEAVWWLVAGCCGLHTPACDRCRAQYQANDIRYWLMGLRCTECGTAYVANTGRWVPIKAEP